MRARAGWSASKVLPMEASASSTRARWNQSSVSPRSSRSMESTVPSLGEGIIMNAPVMWFRKSSPRSSTCWEVMRCSSAACASSSPNRATEDSKRETTSLDSRPRSSRDVMSANTSPRTC